MSSPRLIIIPCVRQTSGGRNPQPPWLSIPIYAFITPKGKDASDKYHKTWPEEKYSALVRRQDTFYLWSEDFETLKLSDDGKIFSNGEGNMLKKEVI
jgi:hypothetical protein